MLKKFILLFLFLISLSCSKGDRGELIGVKANKFFPNKPHGMVLIPSGSFTMGPSNPNAVLDQNPTVKTVSVKAFYMDETEITNSEYRQFVNWVRDSIIRTALAEKAAELNATGPVDNTGEEEDNSVMQRFAYLGSENALTGYQKFDSIYNDNSNKRLNWSEELIFNRGDYPDDMDYIQLIESFYLTEDEVFNNVRTWDVEKFIYISSLAVEKLRYKNYIYGYTKNILEKKIQKLGVDYLILRFGMIRTTMSAGHQGFGLALNKNKAAKLIFNNIRKKGIIYPNIATKLIGLFLKIFPVKLIDRLRL